MTPAQLHALSVLARLLPDEWQCATEGQFSGSAATALVDAGLAEAGSYGSKRIYRLTDAGRREVRL